MKSVTGRGRNLKYLTDEYMNVPFPSWFGSKDLRHHLDTSYRYNPMLGRDLQILLSD